jgi:integrase
MHMKWLYPDQFKTHGDIPVALVTNTHALNFLDARSSLSGNAANEDMKQLCSMWNFGIRHYEMPSDKNPFLGLNPYPHKKKKPITPSREIVLKLVGVTTGMDRVFINVLRFTGARRSSALNLVWDDVNFESRIITTWHRKGRKGEWKSVTQPMNKTLHDSLKWWWANRTHKESPYVFTRRDGEPYARRDDWIRKICRKAGVDHISGYHALRRYYASRIMDSGKASLKDAQELIGHSSLRTTEIYVQNINPHHRGIMDAVDDDFETEIHGEDTHCNYEK